MTPRTPAHPRPHPTTWRDRQPLGSWLALGVVLGITVSLLF